MEESMIAIEDVVPGEAYACKFRVQTMLDDLGRPAPNLSDRPLAGVGTYEGIGILTKRDLEQRLVELSDEKSSKEFVVSFDDIWDVDTIEWKEPGID
jgi:hypothetical protein